MPKVVNSSTEKWHCKAIHEQFAGDTDANISSRKISLEFLRVKNLKS